MRLATHTFVFGLLLAPLAQAAAVPSQAFLTELDHAGQSGPFAQLHGRQRQLLVQRLRQAAQPFDQAGIAHVRQRAPLADEAWLSAQGYDFAKTPLQQADIQLLEGFNHLPASLLTASTATVARINHDASPALQDRAVLDADGIAYLYYLADALGPRLGNAFLDAYEGGKLGKAAALIKASEVSTAPAKQHFDYPRPFLRLEKPVTLVADRVVLANGAPYTASAGAFPSGHSTVGYTDSLLLAAMLPERAAALLARGAGYGYSRQVLGVHYPLDVIGGRMIAQYNVAHYLADSRYRQLFDEARDQLRTALTQACGMALAKCAADAGAQDPWDGSNARTFARYTLDYGLPAAHAGGYPVAVPKRAAMLAEPLLPQLSSAQRLERLSKVDSAAELGLDNAGQGQWQRLDLLGALPRP
ncbi:phosphatase PAP2 family protein [Pseudomonas sp. JUb52]|uniref:phosphatase PAP2 family protein n=1 Tax=Pseudomonas sp. JUb52 TaxID=2485127 RepID=UPI0010435B95|nr:phosphatase PAP2 family protein [Pseudomonas sp. JUb52]TCQ94459.1 PAP2 superfamily protein [Pseudomonas sp. JUb52]